MLGFLGQHEYQIDAKGRVSLPSAFRHAMSSSQMVLVQSKDTHLDLYPADSWKDIRKNLRGHMKANRPWVRQLLSRASPIEPDKHGRIRIPPQVRERVGLEDSVLFVGLLDRIELWPPARFEEHLREEGEYDDDFADQIFG